MGMVEGKLHVLKEELQFRRLLPSLTLGVVMGITEVIYALSVGSLLFSGDLTPYLFRGIGVALTTATIMLIGISLGTSIRGVTGSLQDSPAVLLAIIVSSLVATLPLADTGARLTTILVSIAVVTLATGMMFLALGILKLGSLIRFLPYPVLGGFLAGTGWLLVKGSIGVMTGLSLTLENIPALIQPEKLILWVSGTAFALILFFSLRRIKHYLVMPTVLLIVIGLFYGALSVTGTSIAEAADQGLLIGEVSSEAGIQLLNLESLMATDWAAIWKQAGNIGIILAISVVSLLLNSSALELAFQQDVDLNHELRIAGLTNIFSGICGGTVGYHALDISTLCGRAGSRSRIPGLIAGAICAVVLLAGLPLLAFYPKPILGGLLFFMGMSFLVEWVVDGWSRLPRADYAVVLLILVVIGVTDFIVGVAIGLTAMIVLFVLRYSRINVVRDSLTGAEIKSTVERYAHHRRELRKLGEHISILKLQGYIFFGTAHALFEQIQARVNDTDRPSVRYIILDFRRVTGLDSSAAISFVKVLQLAEAGEIHLLLTNVPEDIRQQLELAGLFEGDHRATIFSDLDHGLEWCENHLLEAEMVTIRLFPDTLQLQLAQSGFKKTDASRLMKFLEMAHFEKGDALIRQGDKADDLFFIESGSVSVYLELEDDKRMRLQTMGMGTIVGELGLYLGSTRSASVIADAPTVAYRLTQKSLLEMKKKEAKLATAFHEFIVRMLSERLVAANRLIEEIQK
jgi:SulP family sulfate permease